MISGASGATHLVAAAQLGDEGIQSRALLENRDSHLLDRRWLLAEHALDEGFNLLFHLGARNAGLQLADGNLSPLDRVI